MNVYQWLGVLVGIAIAPIAKQYGTSHARRWVKRRIPEGKLKRILLTPMGYTAKARREAEMQANMDDLLRSEHLKNR